MLRQKLRTPGAYDQEVEVIWFFICMKKEKEVCILDNCGVACWDHKDHISCNKHEILYPLVINCLY